MVYHRLYNRKYKFPNVDNDFSKRGEQIIQTWRTNSRSVDNELYKRV